jgi:FtsZ-binding cell division protein ZapB
MRELEGKVAQLMQDKRELEVRNKILMTDLTTWQEHVEMLGSVQVSHLNYSVLCSCSIPVC